MHVNDLAEQTYLSVVFSCCLLLIVVYVHCHLPLSLFVENKLSFFVFPLTYQLDMLSEMQQS